jgi:hypothetical protein
MSGAAAVARLRPLGTVTAFPRLFGGGLVRGERDFGAMIFETPAELQHAMAGL